MIKLLNGRGQIGEGLCRLIKDINLDFHIYHTWNFVDKEKPTQETEYNKFKTYIDNNPCERIIFISTSVNNDNWYHYYKKMSENCILKRGGRVIRLPNILGKGICTRFRDDENIRARGVIELLNIKNACNQIIQHALCFNDNPSLKICDVHGETINAEIVRDLILFGKKATARDDIKI